MGETRANLRTYAQQEADKEGDAHIGDPEWNRRLNAGYRALWNRIRRKGGDFFTTSTTFTLSASSRTLSLTSFTDWGRMRRLDYLTGSGEDDHVRVRRYSFDEEGLFSDRRYCIVGTNLRISSLAVAAGNYRIWYESRFTPLTAESGAGGTVDDRVDQWNEFIYLHAAAAGRDKEESDASDVIRRLRELEVEIDEFAGDQDVSEPARIVDVGSRLVVVADLPDP